MLPCPRTPRGVRIDSLPGYDTGCSLSAVDTVRSAQFEILVPKFASILLLLGSILWPGIAAADEITRQVQEELRRRHLYYSDIDGRSTGDVAAALKKYQERQGFPPTGIPNDETLRSLGIINEPAAPADGTVEVLPDIPVLRSDSAPQNHEVKPPVQTVALAPVNSAPPTRKEVREFVQKYFAACASPNVHDELEFYADRIDYFDHGTVDKAYIQNELAVYDQRWTRRSYRLGDSIAIAREHDKVAAKVRVAFQVANGPAERRARGQTNDTLGITRRADSSLQIVSIAESRVTQSQRSRRGHTALVGDPVVHSVQKVLRSIFSNGRDTPRKSHSR